MKKFTALFLVISFIVMNCATYERGEGIKLEPNQKPGIKVVIQKTDGQQLRGELITVKQNSLLLKESESGVDIVTLVSEIKLIKIVRPSRALEWELYASSIIFVFALLWESSWLAPEDRSSLPELIFGSMLCAAPFALFGAALGRDQKIQFEGRSDSEIKEILEDLRKKARVPNFQ